MCDPSQINQEIVKENDLLKQRIHELEQAESERKMMEELLRENEKRLHEAQKMAHIGVWRWIAETDIVTWTEELYRIAGLDPMMPAPTYAEHPNIYAPESWDRLKVAVKKAQEAGVPYQLELKLIRPDGAIRNVNAFGGATYDSHWRITGLHGTLQDITERKLMEEALRESEEKFRTIFENSSSAMAIVERDTTISMVNREYLKLGLFEEMDIIGKSWTTQIPPGDLERLKEYNRRRLTDPKSAPNHYEFTFYRKDGEIRHALISVAIIPTSQKIVASFVDITERKIAEEALQHAHDELEQRVADRTEKLRQANEELQTEITDRKRAEAVLRASEERFDQLVEQSSTIAWEVDIQGLYTYVSHVSEAILGYRPDEIVGRMYFYDLHSESGREAFKKEAFAVFNRKEPFLSMESAAQTKDGRHLWLAMNGIPLLNTDGTLRGYRGSYTDITERKRIEADKEKIESQNRQLQKAKSLGRMAGAIAHHFNNKLGVVMGNLDMAMDKLPQGMGPVENLTAAMKAAGKAAEMSGLMLTYLGQASHTREPIDLSEACRRSLPILRVVMPGKVVMETDLPSPGPVINANANQIQQILTNLITNAWEAVAEDSGSIYLRVKTVSLTEIPTMHRNPIDWQSHDNAYACLEVTDTGCGIADKDTEKLFDPFFSSKFTGRGMGLAIVMGIVRAHGGVVTVESEPGIGSNFRVFFPVSGEEVLRQPDKALQATEFEGGGTILLVDDEEMVREMAKTMLTRLGFTVLEAKDGVEAVEIFRQHRDEIRLVLSDLTMPRMNGWETLTALRKLAPDIPVILASGYDKDHVMAGDHTELPQVFLGKPYRLKELSGAISQALISKT
jgi:PAS domain S-box-containing protein